MPARKTVDERPGEMPDIRTDGNSVTFHLKIAGLHASARLAIRCDPDGTVWVSTEEEAGPPHGRNDAP
jgi:hypothetical protein